MYSGQHVGRFDKAIGYDRQLLKKDEAAGLNSGVAAAQFNTSSVFEIKGEYEAALIEYRHALKIDVALKDTAVIAAGESSVGALLVKQGKAAEAMPWIDYVLAYVMIADDVERTARVRLARVKAPARSDG